MFLIISQPRASLSAIVQNSIETPCWYCGKPIIASPSSQAMIVFGGFVISCFECCEREVNPDEEAEMQPPTRHQLLEIETWSRRN